VRRALLAHFDALAAQIGTPEVTAVRIQADLTPMNIIADDRGRVTVLDFTMAKTGTAYHDLSHVYFHVELMAAASRAAVKRFARINARCWQGTRRCCQRMIRSSA
jgi:aminoglycoside phosphotransferase (APT) family kinase protein